MNKKGFTLIELLAVITVLAIIIMITTPIILNVLDDAKKNAAEDSMYLYVKAIEISVNANPKVAGLLEGTYTTKDADLYTGSAKVLDVQSKGDKPVDNGTVVMKKGDVEEAKLSFGGYIVVYKNKKATILSSSSSDKTYSIGEVVYFDPTGAVTDCNASKIWTSTNTETTCYRWNVIKDNGTSIDMLLDHNTTPNSAWVSKEDYIADGGLESDYGSFGNNDRGPITALKRLKEDVSSWRTNIKGTARLINAEEIDKIGTENTWLYQNLSSENTITKPDGYWTNTISTVYTFGALYVTQSGDYYVTQVWHDNKYGVRPVITVSKSNI